MIIRSVSVFFSYILDSRISVVLFSYQKKREKKEETREKNSKRNKKEPSQNGGSRWGSSRHFDCTLDLIRINPLHSTLLATSLSLAPNHPRTHWTTSPLPIIEVPFGASWLFLLLFVFLLLLLFLHILHTSEELPIKSVLRYISFSANLVSVSWEVHLVWWNSQKKFGLDFN